MLQTFLAGRFGREFVKTSFWKPNKLKGHILLKHLPICSQMSFESAAIIGDYFSARKEIFVDLLGEPGKINRSAILDFLKRLWDEKVEKFGREPKNFHDFVMESEQARILTGFGYSIEALKDSPDLISDIYMTEGNKEIPVVPFLQYLSRYVILEGFAGGLHDPALVKKLWHNSYEVIRDDAEVARMVKHGVLSQSEAKAVKKPIVLRERQTQMSGIVREFVSKHFPDHMGQLFD
jgi:hypothetical protein